MPDETVEKEFNAENIVEFEDQMEACVSTKLTKFLRVEGPFTVQVDNGVLRCEDGYVGLTAEGKLFPISAEEFNDLYAPVVQEEVPPPANQNDTIGSATGAAVTE